jgi:2'-5' RNA ligase
MAKGSGTGSSGVAGGSGIGGGAGGKFDEHKVKRANDGKFSSSGGGGGKGAGGGGAKPTIAGKEVAASSGKKVGGRKPIQKPNPSSPAGQPKPQKKPSQQRSGGVGGKPTIQSAAKALQDRGYELGSGSSSPAGGKWTTTYQVKRPDGKVSTVEASALKGWLNKPHKKGEHPPEHSPNAGKKFGRTEAQIVTANGGENTPSEKPSVKEPAENPSAKPERKTPTFAAPKDAVTVPAGKAKSMPLKEAAAVESRGNQIGNPINAKLKDGSTARLYTMEDPAGRRFRVHADDVASWLETDAQKASDPKKFGGEIVGAEKAKGKKSKASDGGDGAKSGVSGKAGVSGKSGKSEVVDAEVVPDSPSGRNASHHNVKHDARASALYAEMTRPKPTMASSVAAWAASKLGMQSYAGPNGSRVMALHMKQMHDAMKENGFNPVQAYQTNFGPVIDYHHAARGLVMRIQRHAGRKGRTAMKLIGMVTGLKKAADSSSIGTLIPLAAQGDGARTNMGGGKKSGGKNSGGKYAGYLKKLKARRGKNLSKSFSSRGGCAMVRLPDNLAEKIIRLQSSISVDDLLGFEDSPHVTVRYGVLASGEEVAGAIRGVGSVTFGLGRLDFFSSEERDVLFVRVLDNQGQLNELRRRIENCCECKQSNYSQYIPHVTVAFLKPGTAERYLSRENPLFGLDVTCYEVRYAEKGEISLEKSRDDLRDDSADFLSPMATLGKSWRISKDQGYNPHRDNSGRFASGGGGGGASSSGSKQLADKYSGPVDSLHSEHRKALTAMPEGSRVDPTVGGRVNVNWDSDNGGGREHLDRVITAAKIQGFKSTGEEVSHDVNGDVEGRSEFFTHPDGHKLYVSTEADAGNDGEDRHAAMMVLEPPPKEKPVAAATPTNPEHADKVAIMPQGAVVMSMKSGVTTSSWSSEGEGGIKDVNALINNAQQMGFTRESRQIDRGKDGSVMSVRAVYSHPDGHRLEIDREVMADGMPPFHSVLMTLNPSAEMAAARASVDPKSAGAVSVRSDGRRSDLAVAKSEATAGIPSLPLAKQGDSDAAAKFAEYFKTLGSYYSGV